jgi:hypothetical protein
LHNSCIGPTEGPLTVIIMLDDVEVPSVVGFVDVLIKHRKSCEKQGKYIEAEMAKNRLDELKYHEDSRRRVSDDLPAAFVTVKLFCCSYIDSVQCYSLFY